MKFASWKKVYDPIVLPIEGADGVEREYTLPVVNGVDGNLLKVARDPESGVTLTNDDVYRIYLGDAHKQMVEDGVSARAISRALITAQFDLEVNRDMAQAYWESGDVPKATAAWLSRSTSTPSDDSTDADGTTKPPASTSGTKRRRK
ncbi:DUF7426 family protein [Gryllotalpicola koreensis]|uniref:DUF7426 domain-containing protein n=1 Tax=Gryllotalpicola koreensis TaxID=993086 RepID=A0ABP8A1R1_9MICO